MPTAVTSGPPSFLASLAQFESYDATPVIGTVFPNKSTQLSQLLEGSKSDELIHDLAVLVSQRGVVFFKDQDITVEQQKILGQKLGELTGKPATSKLHKHPISEDVPELGLEISVISSKGCVQVLLHEGSFTHVSCVGALPDLDGPRRPVPVADGTRISLLKRSHLTMRSVLPQCYPLDY